MSKHPKIVGMKEACEITGLSVDGVNKRIRKGILPCLRYRDVGANRGSIRFYESDLIAYRDSHFVPARDARSHLRVVK